MRSAVPALSLLLVTAALTWADRVTLVSGQTFTGDIVSQTPAEVTIKTAGGIMRFPRTQVAEVVSDRKERQESDRRLAELTAKLVARHLELARWCLENKLLAEARAEYYAVLRLDPPNAEARQGLSAVTAVGPVRPEPDVELVLVDGSRVIGRLSDSHLTLATSHGNLRIPFGIVLALELKRGKGEDRVVTTDFPAKGDIVDQEFTVDTRVGRFTVDTRNIASMTVKHKLSPTYFAGTLTEDAANLQTMGLEVMLVVDATDSMEGVLLALKRDFNKLGNCLRAKVPGVRIGVVAYRDSKEHDPEEYEWEVRLLTPLTDRLDQVRDVLVRQGVAGGGDMPEAVYAGMTTAMEKAGWTAGARKIIVLVGDAPPHAENDGLNKLYRAVQTWSADAPGFVHTIDTTGYGKHMQEFKEIALRGRGGSFALARDEDIARQVAVCVLRPQWSAEIVKAFDAASDSALKTQMPQEPAANADGE